MMKNNKQHLSPISCQMSPTTWQAEYRTSSDNNCFIGSIGVCA